MKSARFHGLGEKTKRISVTLTRNQIRRSGYSEYFPAIRQDYAEKQAAACVSFSVFPGRTAERNIPPASCHRLVSCEARDFEARAVGPGLQAGQGDARVVPTGEDALAWQLDREEGVGGWGGSRSGRGDGLLDLVFTSIIQKKFVLIKHRHLHGSCECAGRADPFLNFPGEGLGVFLSGSARHVALPTLASKCSFRYSLRQARLVRVNCLGGKADRVMSGAIEPMTDEANLTSVRSLK